MLGAGRKLKQGQGTGRDKEVLPSWRWSVLASERSDHELMSKEQAREGSKELPLWWNAPDRGNGVCKGPEVSELGGFAEQHGVQCDRGWVSKEETLLVLAQSFMQRVDQILLAGFPSPLHG